MKREKTAEGGKGREGGTCRRREGGTARVRREEIHMMTSIMAYRNTALLPCCSGIQEGLYWSNDTGLLHRQ